MITGKRRVSVINKAPSNEDSSFERITELKEQVDEGCQEIDIANISAVLEPTKKRARKSNTYSTKLEGAPPSPFPSVLDGGSVRVDNPHHIAAIYTAGYFGKGSVSRGKPCISEQDEALILSPAEAFYLLKYKVIHIMGEGGKCSKQKIWSLFCNDLLFPHKYAVFEHFRAKAWVLRSGLKYGADYMLYQGGPGEAHASYAVKCFSSQCTPDWDVVNCLRRVNETVAKELVLCYVAFKGTTGTSTCLKLCDVTSIMVKRWLPERDREAKVPKQKKEKQSKGTKEGEQGEESVNLIDLSETNEGDSTLKEGSVELGQLQSSCVEAVEPAETIESISEPIGEPAVSELVSESAHRDSMRELGEGVKDLSTDEVTESVDPDEIPESVEPLTDEVTRLEEPVECMTTDEVVDEPVSESEPVELIAESEPEELNQMKVETEPVKELEGLAEGESGAELWKERGCPTEQEEELWKVPEAEDPLASRYTLQCQYQPLHSIRDIDSESVTDSMVVNVDDIEDISALEESVCKAEENFRQFKKDYIEETSFSTQNIEITSTFLEENIEAESTAIEGDLASEDLDITPNITPTTPVSPVKDGDTSTETIDLGVEEQATIDLGEESSLETIFREDPVLDPEEVPGADPVLDPEEVPEETFDPVLFEQGVEEIVGIVSTVEGIFQENVIKAEKSHDTLNDGYLDMTENKENVERSEIIEEINRASLDSISLPDVPLASRYATGYTLQSQYLPLLPLSKRRACSEVDSMIVNIDDLDSAYAASVTSLCLSVTSLDHAQSITSVDHTEQGVDERRDEAAGEESTDISVIEPVSEEAGEKRGVQRETFLLSDEELDVGQAEDEMTFAGSCSVEEEEEESRKRSALSQLCNPSKMRRLEVSARPSIHEKRREESAGPNIHERRREERVEIETSCLLQ